MTIQELANLTADQLEALSEKEKIEILSPYFNVTRPELVQQLAPARQQQKPVIQNLTPAKQKALALLQEEGVDLGFLMRKKR
jgi:uncharacterized membrane protein